MKGKIKTPLNRRQFIGASSVIAAAGALQQPVPALGKSSRPAVLGGEPVKADAFPRWPVFDSTDEDGLMAVLRSGKWGRGGGSNVTKFEERFARLMGARYCLATANGTSALLASVNALGIGPGDEVIVPPYTFVATINIVLACHALPVFIDTNAETFQIDATKIEAAINERTAAIVAVHLGGSTFDVDAVREIAGKHRLPVIEDSCQSHLAEWRGRRTGSFGATGSFSFQASKNLNSGEGGAILTSDEALIEKCYAFHNNSRGNRQAGADFSYGAPGLNLRMTEFQASILMTQMARLEAQSRVREANARYLTAALREAPGLTPASMHDGCTRNAYHLFMMSYNLEEFAGLSRSGFLKALAAEGIAASGGYSPLNKEPFLANAFASRGFQALYSKERLAKWKRDNHTPANDRLCASAVWFTQNMLLGPRRDMDQIVDGVSKIRQHAAELKQALESGAA